MQLDMKQSDDSYSSAAKERMAIELDGLVWRLNEVGSALATLNIFRRADVEIEGKKRRLNDFAQVDLGPDPMAGTFKVIIHNPAAIPGAVAVLKENKFINIDMSSKRELKVVKARLTAQQEDDLETEVKRVTKSSLSKLASIKSDALQRVQAAIKAEYIEPAESKKATLQLDDLIRQAGMHASIMGLIRRKQLIGGGLTFDGPEEEALYKRINDRAYKDVWQDMLLPKVEEDDDDDQQHILADDPVDRAAPVSVTTIKRGAPEPQSAPVVEKDQRQKAIKSLLATADQTVDDKLATVKTAHHVDKDRFQSAFRSLMGK